jgi:hypothetical protein
MAVAIPSSSQGSFATGTTTVVTKPTGLAVGDLMIAQYTYRNSVESHTLPLGFTSVASIQCNNSWLSVSYKIATSSDVSASNFTFTTGASYQQWAGIMRVTGFPIGAPITQSNSEGNLTGSSTSGFTTTVTPFANSMLILLMATSAAGGATYTNPTTYSVATDNPAWTELWDNSTSSGGIMGVAVAYATRSQTTATGNSNTNASYAGGSGYGWGAVMIAVGDSKDVAVAETATLTETLNYNTGLKTRDTVTLDEDVDADDEKKWSTTPKSSTTWLNIDKS